MNLMLPKISVIVPVYNVENYVSKCIESILNQTYQNLEIIIANDGSTDKSGKICEAYAKNDNRIIIIHQENQGIAMTRNNALDIAGGDYIGFVDSDDWVEPDMYATLYNNAVKYDADISECNFKCVLKSGETYPYSNEKKATKILENSHKIIHNIRLCNNSLCNKLYQRHLFNEIRFPKGKTFEDIFIMHKIIENANKVVLSSECKYYYRFRDTSTTFQLFNLNQMDIIEAHIERYKYFSPKYPALEKTCRKHILANLLRYMKKAYIDNKIELYKEALIKIIETVKPFDYKDCGLTVEEQRLINLLFTDIDLYILAMENNIHQEGRRDAN